MMHIVPFSTRSLFDEVDSMFDDLLWDEPFGWSLFPAQTRRRQPQIGGIKNRERNWSTTLRLQGYGADEVKWECGEGNATVKVHARHQGENEDDFAEIRRTIQIPENVDRDKLQVNFTREGILLIKAPYKENEEEGGVGAGVGGTLNVFNPWRMTSWRDWSSLTDEMRRLQNDMFQLHQESFPGSMSSNFVTNEDGSTKLQLDFDLSGYKPEEIEISQDGNQVNVEAKHEQRTEKNFSMKHFKRSFTLPENVKVQEMTSKLLSGGHLRLEAPCELKEPQQKSISSGGQDIPIQRSSEVDKMK